MTKNFQQNLVDLAGIGHRPHRVSELTFNHAETGFDVAAPVVVGIKRFLIQCEVGVKPLPHRGALTGGIRLKRNIRGGTVGFNMAQIGVRQVRLIGRNLSHVKPLCGAVQQFRQHRRVMDITRSYLDRSNDIRLCL